VKYEELLRDVYAQLPKARPKAERFEMPVVDSVIQGNKTIIRNFSAICNALRRAERHLLKWLTRELAAPGTVEETRAILQTRLPRQMIQRKLEAYFKEFVVCRECKRPDTRLVREGRITLLVCEACGARAAVRQI
jgi:translation initiation factor 2 subunit 2